MTPTVHARARAAGAALATGAALVLVAPPALADTRPPAPSLSFEAGAAWQRRNDVQVPNEPPATRFPLDGILGEGPFATGRVALDWPLSERQSLRFLIAPLSIDETGTTSAPIVFEGATFAPGTIRGKYAFNSYRASWRWRFHESERWTWNVGAALKVRDAEIRLTQGNLSRRKTDTGVVPLLALEGQWRFAPRWRGVFDFEGLASPQGRAIDVALKVAYDATPRLAVNAGYRLLDGGADNDTLYTFARFDYAVVGVTWKLR
jgi:hypothetical protein